MARKRQVQPADLARYPLVNAPHGIPDPAMTAMLDKLGAFRTEPRRVEAYYTAVIRRYVELNFGIGLVVGLPGLTKPPPSLHMRSMSKHFGRIPVYLVLRKDALISESIQSFAQGVRSLLKT